MARYKLVSVKLSRSVQKMDAEGKPVFKVTGTNEDGEPIYQLSGSGQKIPVYEVKKYGLGSVVELSPAEAVQLKNDIQPIGGTFEQPTPLQFTPDDDTDDTDETDPKIAAVLSGNVDQVLTYINDHEDEDETLEALREAEKASNKPRKGVLDALNDLLGE